MDNVTMPITTIQGFEPPPAQTASEGGLGAGHATGHALPDLLKRLSERLQANLGASEESKGFLTRNGIPDESVWRAFRIGVGQDHLPEGLTQAETALLKVAGLISPERGRFSLGRDGLCIPTYEPSDPERPVGFVRVRPAQSKHSFAGIKRGIGCSPDINEHDRLILADNPFLALRLSQAGARGIALVEEPEVLSPMGDWLSKRKVVLVSYKRPDLERLKAAIESLGIDADSLVLGTTLAKLNATHRNLLGLAAPPQNRAHAESTEPTPQMIQQVIDYAQNRLRNGEGLDLLKQLGGDNAEFVSAFGIGYLPKGYAKALPISCRSMLRAELANDSLIVPAFDERGEVVDLFLARGIREKKSIWGIYPERRGLVAPKVATAYDRLIVTDRFEVAARTFAAGSRNVLLLRGVEDATNNAQRIYQSGVRKAIVACQLLGTANEIATALGSAGISVEAVSLPRTKIIVLPIGKSGERGSQSPAQPRPEPRTEQGQSAELDLVSHDPQTGAAVFTIDGLQYQIAGSAGSESRIEILDAKGTRFWGDCDLSVQAQRDRMAPSAAAKLGVSVEDIHRHLGLVSEAVQRLQNPEKAKPQVDRLPASEREEAVALLRRPDLLDTICSDLEALGWVGEDRVKKLAYLASISRKSQRPILCVRKSSPNACDPIALDAIASLIPPEDLLRFPRLTAWSLLGAGEDGLRNKVLVLDDASSMKEEAVNALRLLHLRGALSTCQTRPEGSSVRTKTTELRGPLAMVAESVGEMDENLESLCLLVDADDSPEQTQRVLEAQRLRRVGLAPEDRDRIVVLHRNAQRLLDPLPVTIPFADRIQFPGSSVRHRQEQENLLRLIEASATAHQYQRLRDHGSIVATEEDFKIAVGLLGPSIAQASDDLGANARDVLDLIQSEGLTHWTIQDLRTLRPDWTYHRFYSGLGELVRMEIVRSQPRTKPTPYELIGTTAGREMPVVTLRAPQTIFASSGTFEGVAKRSLPREATG